MSTRLHHELTYDAAPAAVSEMMRDAAFRERVCTALKVVRATVTAKDDVVTIEQTQASKSVPSFAKKFVGEEITIVQTETWKSPMAADVTVAIPGKPGEARGTTVLAETGDGTTVTVILDIKVGLPLVGGKIEGLIRDLLLKALQRENTTGRTWLDEEH
jgi:hypothetical protein